jgi:hypothetical protein
VGNLIRITVESVEDADDLLVLLGHEIRGIPVVVQVVP